MSNPFYQLSELDEYLLEQESKKCMNCSGTGHVAIPGTEHIGPDGKLDYDIKLCHDCLGSGKR